MRRTLFAASCVASLIGGSAITSSAFALKLDPLVVQLAPSGTGSVQSYEITNDGDKASTVTLSTVRRAMDENGIEKLTAADRELRLSVRSLTLQPGEKRKVDMIWAGSANPKKELAYRLIAEQRAVEATKPAATPGQLNVNVVVRVQGAIYVALPQAAPKLSVASAKPIKRKDAVTQLAIVLKNTGDAHATLQNPALTLQAADGKSVTLDHNSLASMAAQTVLAGHQRRFIVPWPADFPAGPIAVRVTQG